MQAPAGSTQPGAPVFLICSERSGSNLIGAMLGAHPGVHAHPPCHIGRDLLLNLHALADAGPAAAAWPVLVERIEAKIAEFRGKPEAGRAAAWLRGRERIEPCEIARFLWLELPPEAAGRRVFVKENGIHRLMFFLLHCFPDAQFVFQVRDPRDVMVSAMALRPGWLGNKFGSLRNAMAVWREDQLGGLAALGLLGPGRVHLQRYEDLVEDSAQALTRLCAFLGLPFDPAMLEFHRSEGAQQLARTAGAARANLGRSVMSGNFRKYRGHLSPGRIRAIEAHLGPLMQRFGYPLEYPCRARPRRWNVLAPQLSELVERWRNGEMRPWYTEGSRRMAGRLEATAEPLLAPLWDSRPTGRP